MYEYSMLSHDINNPNISYNPVSAALENTISHYMQTDETPLHGGRISIEYQGLLENGMSFSFGLQPQFVTIAGNFSYDTLNVMRNQWGSYRSLENYSELRRGIYAGFVDLSGQWDWFQYQLGVRLEHTDQRLAIDNPDYFNLFKRPVQDSYLVQQTDIFPSLHATYQIRDNDRVFVAASRRISRSPVKNMFPFLYRRHLEVYVVGDPALKPEYIQNLELTYQTNISDQLEPERQRKCDAWQAVSCFGRL